MGAQGKADAEFATSQIDAIGRRGEQAQDGQNQGQGQGEGDRRGLRGAASAAPRSLHRRRLFIPRGI